MKAPLVLLAIAVITTSLAHAQSYQSVYAFPTAASPGRDLVSGPDGLLYGCTDATPGTIYRLNPTTSVVTTLATLTNAKGVSPRGSLCFASDGKCYGIAAAGGTLNYGTLFRFDVATNTITALFHFSGTNGATPEGGLVEGPEGWLYGITREGGSSKTMTDPGKGTVFQFKPSTSEFSTIHHFNGTNGATPRAALCKASDGKLYGTFSDGGPTAPAFGGIIVVLPTKTVPPTQASSILGTYYFKNVSGLAPTGSAPRGRLVETSTGTLHGTCSAGGANGQGSLFTFGTASKTINLIASFKGYTNALSPYTGSTPLAGITLGPDGALYGACSSGGSSTVNTGTLWQYRPSTKVLARLHDFATSADFTLPRTAFALAADSALYATADHGLYRVLLAGRAPVVGAPTASLITSTGAKLTSTITPGGLVTRWWYEYGTSAAALTQRTPEQIIWNGVLNFSASINLTALAPHTTYHYRLVTSNPQGTTYGVTKTFATPNTAPKANPDHFAVANTSPTTFDVIANDTDADNDALTVLSATQGKYGTLTFAGRNITYTSKVSPPKRDTFSYTLTDGFGGKATATVSTHEIYAPNPDDKYVQWAKTKWGTAIALNPLLKDTLWGESADPDKDSLQNLVEYAFNLNPLVNDKALLPTATIIKPTALSRGSVSYQLTQRADDPALAIIPQVSYDALTWNPRAPTTSLGWTGDGVWFFKGSPDPTIVNGYQQVIYAHNFTTANAYARLTVLRNTATVTAGSVFDALTFPDSIAPGAGQSAESVPVNLTGFHGSVLVTATGGARLIVNGIDMGTSATILAGSSLRLRAQAGGSGSYGVTIGGVSKTWSVTLTPAQHPAPIAGTSSGYTPVQASVSPTGASQISIPILTSPGVGGIEPKLSISYSSQGSNGPLGVGFGISGLSSISRVPRTLAIDGIRGAVRFDANDRFALDGQRLIRISGNEGEDGTEYRTETMDSGNFSRITCYGQTGSGPQRWVVQTKAGLTLTFGTTDNSQIIAPRSSRSGYVRDDIYTNVPGSYISDLTNAPTYPNSPSLTTYLPQMTSGYDGTNFGQRLRGFLVPKISGSYTFWIGGDDLVQLKFNSTGTDAGGASSIATNGVTSPPFNLVAGNAYYIEALHKQGPGSQYLTVTWNGPGISNAVIGGDYLMSEDPTLPMEPPGVLTWALTKITDSVGNEMAVSYDDVARQRGESLVTSIAYTSNPGAGITAQSEVDFDYQARSDTRKSFAAGVIVQQLQRLAAVRSRTRVAGVITDVRAYTLVYRQSQLTNASLLSSVTEATPDLQTRTTSIDWMDGPTPTFTGTRTDYPPHPSQWNYLYTQVGDFNGDGRSDLVSQGDDGQLTVMLRKVDSDFQIVRSAPTKGFNRGAMWVGDFNGDGLTDILTRPSGSTRIVTYLSNGDGMFTAVLQDQEYSWDGPLLLLGDYNGDGRTDFFTYINYATLRFRVFLSNGDGTFQSVVGQYTDHYDDGFLTVGEFNGDGCSDLVFNRGTVWYLWLSDGAGHFTEKACAPVSSAYSIGSQPVAGDFNGDGVTDIMRANGSKLNVFLFDGDGVVEVVQSDAGISGFGWRTDGVGNFNADGMTDMISWYNYGGQRDIVRFISSGNGNITTTRELNSVPWDPNNTLWIGDFNGDGKADMVSSYYQFTHFVSNQRAEDLVTKVTTAHGGYTKFDYKPLTDSTVYTKGTGATYPCADLAASLYVVSDISSRNGVDGDPFVPSTSGTFNENHVSYQYEQGVTCMDGRGFRGFGKVITTDADHGIQSISYNIINDGLLAGRPYQVDTLTLDNRLISRSASNWVATPTTQPSGLKTYFITDSTHYDKEYEINGQGANPNPVKTTVTNGLTFDAYGNVTHMRVDHGNGFEEITDSTHTNVVDATRWWLGRMTETTVTQISPSSSATRRSTFEYSPTTGLLTRETLATSISNLELRKDYIHDAVGNITQSTLTDTATGDTRSTITRYSADKRFILETENDYHHIETKTYDPLTGQVLTQTGPNGLTTTFEYDAFGRPITELHSDGTRTITQYLRCTPGVNGAPARAVHCVRTQSSGSGVKATYFDVLDRQLRTDSTHFSGSIVSAHQVYNSKGEVSEASDPYFGQNAGMSGARKTLFEYDEISRKKKTTAPGTRITTSTYNGLTSTVTNPLGQSFSAVSDVRGRTTSATSFGSATVTNTFDPYGNLLQVSDGNGHLTTMQYDARGHKTQMTEPNSGTTRYTYNAFGEIKSQTDARGITVTMTYDKLGRLTKRSEPEGDTLWEYDNGPSAKGKPVRASMPAQDYEELYRYDAQGRPVETVYRTGNSRFVTGTSYDQYGRPLIVTYPTGFAIRNEYNSNGYLARVVDVADSRIVYWTAVSYNERGQTTEERFGNGLSTWRSYEANTGLIDTIKTGTTQSNVIQSLQYQFNSIGNLVHRSSIAIDESFGYDAKNQLTSIAASINGQAQPQLTVQYDALGNITSRSDIGSYSYGSSAGPHAVTAITGSTTGQNRTLKYDLTGNCTANGSTAITYTSNNQPSRISKGSTTLQFSYGPGRARYRQTETIGTTYNTKLYIGSLYEREEASTGTITHTHYIPGGSGVIAIKTLTQTSVGTTEKLRYLHKDHLGSPHIISDEQGKLAETQLFDAWGRRRVISHDTAKNKYSFANLSETHSTDRGYTGHEMLDSVGLIHMNGRLYDPTLGRFMSVDPIVQEAGNVLNLNRYSYVLNNPLSMTDPSGFSWLSKAFKSVGKFLKNNWKTIVAVGIGVLTGGAFAVLAGAQGGIFGAVSAAFGGTLSVSGSAALGAAVFGGGMGFGSAFSGTLLAGGSIGDALRAGIIGGVAGAVQGRLAFGIGSEWGHATTWSNVAQKTIAHGVAGGAVTTATGGRFQHGFLAGAVTPGSGMLSEGLPTAARFAVAAVTGGTASELGGGKFANGAVTSATAFLFNEAAQAAQDGFAFESPTVSGAPRGSDSEGSGAYGAPRGTRTHDGFDFAAEPWEAISSPIDGVVSRSPLNPYGDGKYSGVLITNTVDINGKSTQVYVKLWYVQPLPSVLGQTVSAGQMVGFMQNRAAADPGMINHVHALLHLGGKSVDPTRYMK